MNIVDLQNDIFYSLKSWDMVANINVVLQRKLRLDSMVSFAQIYQTPANGCSGIGILVEMPSYKMSNNLSGPGPQTELLVSLLVIECPPINLNSQTGTGTDAESVAALLLPFLHQWLDEGQGEMYPQDTPIAPANDLPPGTLGYRVSVKMQHSPMFLPRVTQPTISIDGSFNVTLSGVTNGTAIYYTLDGTTPAVANQTAVKYTGPFQTTVGQTVRWQGWIAGYTPSNIGSAIVGS